MSIQIPPNESIVSGITEAIRDLARLDGSLVALDKRLQKPFTIGMRGDAAIANLNQVAKAVEGVTKAASTLNSASVLPSKLDTSKYVYQAAEYEKKLETINNLMAMYSRQVDGASKEEREQQKQRVAALKVEAEKVKAAEATRRALQLEREEQRKNAEIDRQRLETLEKIHRLRASGMPNTGYTKSAPYVPVELGGGTTRQSAEDYIAMMGRRSKYINVAGRLSHGGADSTPVVTVPSAGAAKETVDQIKSSSNAVNDYGKKAKEAATQIKSLTQANKEAAHAAHLMHSGVRGVTASLGGMFLTYGKIQALMPAFAAASTVRDAVKEFANLDYQMRMSQALSEDYSVSLDKMSDSVRKVSKEFGLVPEEIAKGVRALAQAGVSAADATNTLIKDVARLSIVGEMGVQDAAVSLTGAVQAFNLDWSQGSRVVDVYTKAAAMSNASVQSITDSMKQASQVAKQYNQSVEDVGTALTALAMVNITGSAAGTAYRNMMAEISAPKGEAKKLAAELGISIFDAKTKNIQSFYDEYLPLLRSKLAEYDAQSQNYILNRLFNERGSKTVHALLRLPPEQLKSIRGGMADATGFAATAAYEANDNLRGDAKKVQAGWAALMTEVGKPAEIPLRSALKDIVKILENPEFKTTLSGMVSILANIVKAGTSVLSFFVEWGNVLMGVGAAITVAGTRLGKIPSVFDLIANSIGNARNSAGSSSTALEGVASSAVNASNAMGKSAAEGQKVASAAADMTSAAGKATEAVKAKAAAFGGAASAVSGFLLTAGKFAAWGLALEGLMWAWDKVRQHIENNPINVAIKGLEENKKWLDNYYDQTRTSAEDINQALSDFLGGKNSTTETREARRKFEDNQSKVRVIEEEVRKAKEDVELTSRAGGDPTVLLFRLHGLEKDLQRELKELERHKHELSNAEREQEFIRTQRGVLETLQADKARATDIGKGSKHLAQVDEVGGKKRGPNVKSWDDGYVGLSDLATKAREAAGALGVVAATQRKVTSIRGYDGKYDDLFVKYGKQSGVDPALLRAVMMVESRGNPNARSGAGARGLMQIMPETAKNLGITDVDKLYDPEVSIRLGAMVLAQNLKRFGNTDDALRAYNGGWDRSKWGRMKETSEYAGKVNAYYQGGDKASVAAAQSSYGKVLGFSADTFEAAFQAANKYYAGKLKEISERYELESKKLDNQVAEGSITSQGAKDRKAALERAKYVDTDAVNRAHMASLDRSVSKLAKGDNATLNREQLEDEKERLRLAIERNRVEAEGTLIKSQAGAKAIEDAQKYLENADATNVKAEMLAEIEVQKTARKREALGLSERDAYVMNEAWKVSDKYAKKIAEVVALKERMEKTGDHLTTGKEVYDRLTANEEILKNDSTTMQEKVRENAQEAFDSTKGKELAASFAKALTSKNSAQDIREWIKEEVLMKPFRMQIEMLLQPIMQQVAGFLFGGMGMGGQQGGGQGGNSAWSQLGNGLLGIALNGFTNWLVGPSTTPSNTFSNAAQTNSNYNFANNGNAGLGLHYGGVVSSPSTFSTIAHANGGVMNEFGSVPLRRYAKGGVASSPQLALFGEGSGAEAYVPLPDGRSIPVTVEGSANAGGSTVNNVSINVSVDQGGNAQSSGGGGGNSQGEALGRAISQAVQAEIMKQKRPGGALYNNGR